jgi:hypothetical protein
MRHRAIPATALLVGLVSILFATPAGAATEFTTDVFSDECTFSPFGENLFFHTLNPGDFWRYEGEDGDETVELLVRVLTSTRTITYTDEEGELRSVRTRVIEEREWIDDELVEVSRNFYARCLETGAIYYFGEDVDIYEDGVIVSHDGAWRAGVNGAMPGIIMPGTFLLGAAYFQEVAPDVALDRAEHVEMGLDIDVPAGEFSRCVQVDETTPLEPGHVSVKLYCPEVGLVADGPVELISFRRDDD